MSDGPAGPDNTLNMNSDLPNPVDRVSTKTCYSLPVEPKRSHTHNTRSTLPDSVHMDSNLPRPSNFKEDIQEIVASNLKPWHQRSKISDEQFTNINRDICRQLYKRVMSQGYLRDNERLEVEAIATREVELAVKALGEEAV